jgi:hypothetical protein
VTALILVQGYQNWANFRLLGDYLLWAFKKMNFFLKSKELIFTKNGLGYILGDFFTNTSGHPVLVFTLELRTYFYRNRGQICEP